MPRYPGGDYYLPPGTTAAPDTTIQSTPYNTFTADVETELNRQIDKDADQDAALASGLASINASTVSFAPAGDIAATNVQAAIVEVDTEMHAADAALAAADALKVLKAGDVMTGNLTVPITFTHLQAPSGIGGDFNTTFTNTKFNTFVYAGESSAAANAPTGGGWYMCMTMKHSNTASPYGLQVAYGWAGNDNEIYTRTISNNAFGAWVRHLNANNYSSYALPLSGGTLSGNLTVGGVGSFTGTGNLTSTCAIKVSGAYAGGIWLEDPGTGRAHILGEGGNLVFGTQTGTPNPPARRMELRNGGDHRLYGDWYISGNAVVANYVYFSTGYMGWDGSSLRLSGGNILHISSNNSPTNWFCNTSGTPITGISGVPTSLNCYSSSSGASGMYIALGANAWTAISDARLPYKKTARPITALDKLANIQLYENEIGEEKRLELFAKAQELYQAFPHVVIKGNDDETLDVTGMEMGDKRIWGVSYDRLGMVALQAVKELLAKVKALQTEVDALKARLP